MKPLQNYHKDSEGNWAEEIPFSDIGMKKIDDGWIPYEETLTKEKSAFYHEPITEEETERKEKRLVFIQMALGSLTPKQREVIVLSFNHHKPNKDIAKILKISEQAVSERKRLALKKLRKMLIGK